MRRRKFLWWCLPAVVVALAGLAGPVVAQPQPPQPVRTDLSLRLLDGFYNQGVTPGKEETLLLEVRNNGTTNITNIVLSTRNTPEGWIVDLRPGSIARLVPGASQTVDVVFLAPGNAERGNYNLTLIAEAAETRTATGVLLRVERTSPFWLWMGGAIAAVVIASFIIVFLRLGRH